MMRWVHGATCVGGARPLLTGLGAVRLTSSAVPAGSVDLSPPDKSTKIKDFATFYTQLTLKEITELQREVFRQLGHTDVFYEQALLRGLGGGGGGGGTVVMAATAEAPSTTAAASKEEPPKEEKKKVVQKTTFDVQLISYPDAAKIKLIKELRSVTNDPIKEAKDLIEKKGIVAKNLGQADADKLVELFKAAGADAKVQ